MEVISNKFPVRKIILLELPWYDDVTALLAHSSLIEKCPVRKVKLLELPWSMYEGVTALLA